MQRPPNVCLPGAPKWLLSALKHRYTYRHTHTVVTISVWLSGSCKSFYSSLLWALSTLSLLVCQDSLTMCIFCAQRLAITLCPFFLLFYYCLSLGIPIISRYYFFLLWQAVIGFDIVCYLPCLLKIFFFSKSQWWTALNKQGEGFKHKLGNHGMGRSTVNHQYKFKGKKKVKLTYLWLDNNLILDLFTSK